MKFMKGVMAGIVGLVMAMATMVPVPALTAATALKVGTAGVAVAYMVTPAEVQAAGQGEGISGPVGNSLATDAFLIAMGGMLWAACPQCMGIAAAVAVPATALVMKQVIEGPAMGGRGS